MIRQIAAMWLATLCSLGAAHAETVLITGSNRGLGLEFAKQYAEMGWHVIATTRNPARAQELNALAKQFGNISVEELDVLDFEEINSLAKKYRDTSIDVLINNAGVLGDLEGQTLGTFDYDNFQRVMGVNVYGALAVSEAFRKHVAVSEQKKIIGITSGAGIISRGSSGGNIYFYRASKVALNMGLKGLAADLRNEGIVVGIVAPGAADTDMRRELVGDRADQDQDSASSVSGMIRVISNLTQANSSQPFNYDGQPMPW